MNRDERNKRPSYFYPEVANGHVVNANLVVAVFVSVLVCGVVGASVSPQSATMTETDQQSVEGDLGGDISVFMQRGTAAANGSVDAGMWLAAFESAENQTRKKTLVTTRTETLRARLIRLESRIRAFSANETNESVASQAQRARLAADLDALQTSISEAKTTAASEGVNTSGLDQLSRRAENLSAPVATTDSRAGVNDTVNKASDGQGSQTSAARFTTLDSRAAGTTYRGP